MSDLDRHLDEACCADLVLGLLPLEQQEQALAHAGRCAACEAMLRAHAGATVAARAAERGRASVLPLPVQRFLAGPRGWRGAAIAAAAAAVLLVVMLPSRQGPAPAQPPTAWLEPPGELVRTRAEGTLDPRLADALAAYERRELATAVAALREVQATGAAEQVRRLYLGHALLADAQPIEALAWLSSVERDRLPEPWRTQAAEALVAAWRANGQPSPADSLERTLAR